MKKIDWKKRAPQITLIGIGILVIGVAAVAKSRGECPFAMCANAIAPQKVQTAPSAKDKMTVPDSDWMTNFKSAQEIAKRENKILFLSFSGSDWCSWCMKLDKEVLNKTEFLNWAKKNAILVKIDFPRSIVQSETQKAQNESLARKYNIEGFPTVILAGSDGRVIARSGYRNGGAAAYVKYLEQIQQKSTAK